MSEDFFKWLLAGIGSGLAAAIMYLHRAFVKRVEDVIQLSSRVSSLEGRNEGVTELAEATLEAVRENRCRYERSPGSGNGRGS